MIPTCSYLGRPKEGLALMPVEIEKADEQRTILPAFALAGCYRRGHRGMFIWPAGSAGAVQ